MTCVFVLSMFAVAVHASDGNGEGTRAVEITRRQFWTDYGNGTVERDRFPINYWNDIESKWLNYFINEKIFEMNEKNNQIRFSENASEILKKKAENWFELSKILGD